MKAHEAEASCNRILIDSAQDQFAYIACVLWNYSTPDFLGYIVVLVPHFPIRGERLRKLVVDLQEPRFASRPVKWEESLTAHLNSDQLIAVNRVRLCACVFV